MHRHTLALLGTVLLTIGTAQAQKNILNEELDRASGTRVQVRSVFDPMPPSGYAPMRVVGTSGVDGPARWRFDFTSQTSLYRQQNKHTSSFTLDFPGPSTQSALFLVPVAVPYGDTSSGNDGHSLNVKVSDTGFEPQSGYDNDARSHDRPALALSNGLAEFSIVALNKEVETRVRAGGAYYGGRADLFGSQFEPEDLPDTWLGFSGFDYVLLSSLDWQKLKPGVKRALQEWVRLGGQLHVYLSSGATAASLGLPEGDADRISLGQIRSFTWDGKKLPATDTVGRYWSATQRAESLVEGHTKAGDWPLIAALGTRSFASWQVIVFLVVFGLLVGPVNLFVLAPAGKRHKLFVTTPLLSIGASVLMVGLILFQDGTGGTGRRFIAVNLEPEEAAAYVTQEQVSRTGVLLGGGFETKQPVLIEPVAMPDTPWVKLKHSHESQPVDLTQEGRGRRGNFFQSRAEQGQVLRASIPTRARLELKAGTPAGEAPVLVSALGFTVEELFYADAAGAVWRLQEPLSTGQAATLVKSDGAARRTQWAAMMDRAQEGLRQELDRATPDSRPHFVARAARAPDFTLETLSSIRWQDDQVVVFGPLVQP